MSNNLTKSNHRSKQEWIFPAFTGCLSLLLFFILINQLLSTTFHPLYNTASSLNALCASLLIFLLSFNRSIVSRLICILLSAFYTQRLIVTYFFPTELDYSSYISFSHANIEDSTYYYFLSVLAIFLGTIISKIFFIKNGKPVHHKEIRPSKWCPNITYFGFTVSFERLSRLILRLLILLYIINFFVYMSGFGLVGTTYDSSETTLKWFLGISPALSAFVLFSLLYFKGNKKIQSLAKLCLILVIINGLVQSQKGFLIEILLSWYLITNILDRQISKRFFLLALFLIIFSVFIFFPAMMGIRSSLISKEITFDYFGSLKDSIFLFLSRLGGFDWLNLWVSVPSSEIPSNASLSSELIMYINKLFHAKIIPQPEEVNLSKLQVQLGRGFANLNELGGHGEIMGGLATSYVFFGSFGGMIYLATLITILLIIEKSSLHPMHKYVLLSTYAVTYILGGGFVLMNGSFFWFLIFTTFLVICIKFMPLQIKHRSLHTKQRYPQYPI